MSHFPKYLAAEAGVTDESSVVCSLVNPLAVLSLGIGLKKGSYLLTTLNSHLTRYMEGGLHETYWSNLKYNVSLKADLISETSDFVVFGLNHLGPLFILLILGYFLSAIVLIIEIIINQLIRKPRK